VAKTPVRRLIEKGIEAGADYIPDVIEDPLRKAFNMVTPRMVVMPKAKPSMVVTPKKRTPKAETPKQKAKTPKVAPIVKGVETPPEPKGIIAYHGSPHSFDRFDISKMGTGEGAQAYGRGLYFAEDEDVAQGYRQRLAEVSAAPFDRIGIPPSQWNAATMFARQTDPTLPEVAARDFAQWVGRDVTPELVDAFKVAKTPGSMYQVRINSNPEDFLDWDQPLRDQPKALQALRDADLSGLKEGNRTRVMLEYAMQGREQDHNLAKGRDLMMGLDNTPGNNFSANTSEFLKAQGFPGVKYLDQGSRDAGEGSRNYVVLDDALINLLRKYAIGGSVAA